MLRFLLARYLRPYRSALTLVLVLQAIAALATLALPTLNARIIDNGIALGNTEYIWRLGALMLVVAVVQIAAAVLATKYAARAAMAAGRDIRDDLFARVSSFSEREVSAFGAGSLITRNTNDVQQVQEFAMVGATAMISGPMLAIGGVVLALRADVHLSVVIAVAIPVLLGFSIIVVARMIPLFRLWQVRLDTMNLIMREQLTGVRVVRAFVREHLEAARYRVANTEMTSVARKAGSLFALLMPVGLVLVNLALVAVVWLGANQINAGRLQVGTVAAVMAYVGQILAGVMIAAFMTVMIPRATVSAERIGEVLAVEPTLLDPPQPLTTHLPSTGAIEFDNVTFTYPGAEEPVLSEVSFRAEPGQTVAVVGSTGAGKTTLLHLTARLIDTTSGTVRVGGVDVRDVPLETLWASEGLVPQRPFLFAGTIGSNVRLGRENASDAEVWWALEVAQAADFVRARVGGLDSRVAQGGTNVSGGQRQRLAIARAVLRGGSVLLLDDSFSALDVATDAKVRAALWSELPQVTKLVVAQRITSVMDADQILVLEDGRLVGRGTHLELLRACPTYQEIVASQLTAAEIADSEPTCGVGQPLTHENLEVLL